MNWQTEHYLDILFNQDLKAYLSDLIDMYLRVPISVATYYFLDIKTMHVTKVSVVYLKFLLKQNLYK